MIPDKPDNADLLATAAAVLKDELLPLLPEERRPDGLMILAIMASAQRELVDAGELTQRQEDRLDCLMPGGGSVADLCRAIQNGAYDAPDAAAELCAVLMADVRDRLMLINPDYLEPADRKSTDIS